MELLRDRAGGAAAPTRTTAPGGAGAPPAAGQRQAPGAARARARAPTGAWSTGSADASSSGAAACSRRRAAGAGARPGHRRLTPVAPGVAGPARGRAARSARTWSASPPRRNAGRRDPGPRRAEAPTIASGARARRTPRPDLAPRCRHADLPRQRDRPAGRRRRPARRWSPPSSAAAGCARKTPPCWRTPSSRPTAGGCTPTACCASRSTCASSTAGGVDPQGRPAVVREVGACLVVDGGNSMGQIGAHFAMRRAIEVAGRAGPGDAPGRGSPPPCGGATTAGRWPTTPCRPSRRT